MAVDQAFRGQGLGGALVWDAVSRASLSEVAVAALVVDAKNEEAATFYRYLGFLPLIESGRQLVLPLEKIKAQR